MSGSSTTFFFTPHKHSMQAACWWPFNIHNFSTFAVFLLLHANVTNFNESREMIGFNSLSKYGE